MVEVPDAASANVPHSQRVPARAWTPVVLLGALLLIGLFFRPQFTFDPVWLLPALNLAFETLVPLTAAAVAVTAYRRTGVAAVLALGAGMAAIGIGSGLLPAVLLYTKGTNESLTLHNTSALLAGACHFAAAIGGMYGLSLGRNRGLHVAVAYGVVSAAIAVVLVLTLGGLTPDFWQSGPTTERQIVLGAASVLFALAALVWWQTAVRDRSIRFLIWYVPGLALFALGLAAVFSQGQVGGLVTWVGRAGQYLGAVYMLAAVAGETPLSVRRDETGTLGIALLQAALPFRPLVESSSDAVIALGRTRRVVYWNEAAHALFGQTLDEAFDRDPVDLLLPDRPDDALRAQVSKALTAPSGGTPTRHTNVTLARAGGALFPAEMATYASPYDDRLLVCVITDITERVTAQVELERRVEERTAELEMLNQKLERANAELERGNVELAKANAAKDEFLGLVSHELKTPVTTILAAGAILERKFGAADADGLFSDLVADAHRLAGIIDNLLALARLESGRQTEREPVAVDRLARRVVESIRRQYPGRKVVACGASGLIVEANSDQLEIVLRNYLTNALKYSGDDTEVVVQLTATSRSAIVSVIDSGPGIRDEQAAALFDAFYRAPEAATVAGLGIGLAVCRRIIMALGGEVRAYSRRDATGSVFEFALPLAAMDDESEFGDAADGTLSAGA